MLRNIKKIMILCSLIFFLAIYPSNSSAQYIYKPTSKDYYDNLMSLSEKTNLSHNWNSAYYDYNKKILYFNLNLHKGMGTECFPLAVEIVTPQKSEIFIINSTNLPACYLFEVENLDMKFFSDGELELYFKNENLTENFLSSRLKTLNEEKNRLEKRINDAEYISGELVDISQTKNKFIGFELKYNLESENPLIPVSVIVGPGPLPISEGYNLITSSSPNSYTITSSSDISTTEENNKGIPLENIPLGIGLGMLGGAIYRRRRLGQLTNEFLVSVGGLPSYKGKVIDATGTYISAWKESINTEINYGKATRGLLYTRNALRVLGGAIVVVSGIINLADAQKKATEKNESRNRYAARMVMASVKTFLPVALAVVVAGAYPPAAPITAPVTALASTYVLDALDAFIFRN